MKTQQDSGDVSDGCGIQTVDGALAAGGAGGDIEGFKQNRKLNGMTQTELGRKAGISQPNITRFESGSYNPSLDLW